MSNEPVFIHDVYSNRRGKGTHAAVRRLQTLMRRCQSAPAADGAASAARGWYLQLDIQNFFNSIDRTRLLDLLTQRITQQRRVEHPQRLIALCRALLQTDPTAQVRPQGNPATWARVPPHKRLGAMGADQGLPIGNLSSQFFANVYLNELDQYIKHVLKCRYYLRYVDDFILLHPDPQVLLAWKDQIAAFLDARLALKLRPQALLHPLAHGADFLGYIVRPQYCLVRRRVMGHLRDRLHHWEKRAVTPFLEGACPHPQPFALRAKGDPGGRLPMAWAIDLPPHARDRLRAQLASYLGHCSHARHFRLIQALFVRFPWLAILFDAPTPAGTPQHAPPFRWIPHWQAPKTANSLPAQWRAFRRAWPNAWLFLQAGRAFYLFDDDAECFAARFAWPLLSQPPWGFRAALALPLRARPYWHHRLRALGLAHLWGVEEGRQRPALKRRVVRELFSVSVSPVQEHSS